MAQTNVQAFSGDVEISGGITQGNQVLYPQRRWEIDLTSGTTTDRFYPTYLASSSPSDVGSFWPINFKVFGESLIGSDPYNEETLIGYARGGGFSDHRAMCKVHSTRYAASEIRFQGLWKGTSSFQNGFVIYMRGGYKYSILTDASTVVENKNIFVVGGSTYALKNSAGVDAYGTSVAISQVMNVTDFVQTGQVTATTGSLILPESTARLGIGTANPGAALDVNGLFKASSMYVPGTIIQVRTNNDATASTGYSGLNFTTTAAANSGDIPIAQATGLKAAITPRSTNSRIYGDFHVLVHLGGVTNTTGTRLQVWRKIGSTYTRVYGRGGGAHDLHHYDTQSGVLHLYTRCTFVDNSPNTTQECEYELRAMFYTAPSAGNMFIGNGNNQPANCILMEIGGE